MTGLGAAIYAGFFALAALRLFMTSDGAERAVDQDAPTASGVHDRPVVTLDCQSVE